MHMLDMQIPYDSLRQIDYLFKKVEGELSEENELNVEDEQSKEEFKELDKSLFHV